MCYCNCIVLSSSVEFPFISDDKVYITGNSSLAALGWNEIWRLFVEPYNPWEFLPLRDLSYWLDLKVSEMNPAGYRVHNIILYLLCGSLVYATTKNLWCYFRPSEVASSVWIASIVTCMFLVHPVHVESVVWVSGRKELLSGVFAMLALWLALKSRREHGLSTFYATATLLAMLAALLSKATTVAVAPVIAILWMMMWRDLPQATRRNATLLWPVAVLLVAGCITLIFSTYSSVKYPAYYGIEAVNRSSAILGWMARLALIPESRHYIYPVLDGWVFGMMYLGFLVFIVGGISLIMQFRDKSIEGFSLAVFTLLCIPYLQLVPFSGDSLVSERFLYLAVWPISLLIVVLVWRFNPLFRVAVLSVCLLPAAYQSYERPKDWISTARLFELDYQAWPGHYSLAYAHIVERQLPAGLFVEAKQAADMVTVPAARDILVGFVEAEKAIVQAHVISDSRDAMLSLKNLGSMLVQPPMQSKWDPPMRNFWIKCNLSYVSAWQRLVRAFPDDQLLRENYAASVMKYSGH